MILELLNNSIGMTIEGVLTAVPNAAAYAYYVFLMSIGSLIALRLR